MVTIEIPSNSVVGTCVVHRADRCPGWYFSHGSLVKWAILDEDVMEDEDALRDP